MSEWAAGWYPDPEQQGQIRYWDGSTWTDHRQPTPEGFGQDAGSVESTSEVDEATRIRPSADRAPETEVMPTSDSSNPGASAGGAAAGAYGADSSYGSGGYGSDSSSYGQGSGYGSDSSSYGQGSGYGSDSSYGQQQPAYGQAGAQPAYGQQSGSTPVGDPPKKGGNKLPLIIGAIVAGLLALCLLGFLAYKVIGGGDDETSSSTTTSAQSSTGTDSSSATSDSPTSSSTTSSSSATSTATAGGGGVQKGAFDQTVTGNGNAVISVPPGDGPGLVEAEYEGNGSSFGNFDVQGVTGSGSDSNDRVFFAFDKFKGTSAYNLMNGSGGTSRLKIEAEGKWKITFKRISKAPDFGTSQKGNGGGGVFKWDGKSSDIRVKMTKPKGEYTSGRIYVRPIIPTEGYNSYLVMESGDSYEGTSTVQTGTKYLVVEAQGDWEITKQ